MEYAARLGRWLLARAEVDQAGRKSWFAVLAGRLLTVEDITHVHGRRTTRASWRATADAVIDEVEAYLARDRADARDREAALVSVAEQSIRAAGAAKLLRGPAPGEPRGEWLQEQHRRMLRAPTSRRGMVVLACSVPAASVLDILDRTFRERFAV